MGESEDNTSMAYISDEAEPSGESTPPSPEDSMEEAPLPDGTFKKTGGDINRTLEEKDPHLSKFIELLNHPDSAVYAQGMELFLSLGEVNKYASLLLKGWSVNSESGKLEKDKTKGSSLNSQQAILRLMAAVNGRQIAGLDPSITHPTNLLLTQPGLEVVSKLTTLKSLTVCMNDIEGDLLSRLDKLEKLKLSNCRVNDIASLTGISTLTDLELKECIFPPGQSLTALQNMPRLTSVSFKVDSKMTDLSILSSCEKLTSLSLRGCNEIKGIKVLSSLANLREVDLSHMAYLEGLSPLSGSNVEKIILRHTSVENLDTLVEAAELLELDLSSSSLSNLKGIARYPKLRSLKLPDRNYLEDLTPLAGALSLEELDLNGYDGNDIKVIGYLKNLVKLNLDNTDLTSLEFIRECTALEELSLEDLGPELNMSPLSNLPSLRRLHINKTQEGLDLSRLSGCTSLEELNLTHAERLPSLSLSTLVTLPNLRILNLKFSSAKINIQDLSGSGITHLNLDRAQNVENLESLDDMPNLQKCTLPDRTQWVSST
jgi:internalin A